MRAFIAFELSEKIKKELSRLQSELRKTDADVRWADPENIHLTLKFFGNIEEARIEVIKEILTKVASRAKVFRISLSGLGAFPDLHRTRVIWAGLGEGRPESERIAKSLEDEMFKTGFPGEDRTFRAHLTLGRVKTDRHKMRLTDKISSLEVRPESCPINKITLFQSTLTPRGPIYTPLHVSVFKG